MESKQERTHSLDLERNSNMSVSSRSSLDSLLSYVSTHDETKVQEIGAAACQIYFFEKHSGVILMLVAQVFSVMMNTAVRILENTSSGMQPQQILFFRMSITTVAITGYLYWQDGIDSLMGRKENRQLLLVRGVGGFLGVFGLYYSLQYLNLGEAVAITFLTPILTSIMCSIVMKTQVSLIDLITGAVSLLGVVLIARPFSPNPTAATLNDASGSVAISLEAFGHRTSSSIQRFIALLVAMLGVLGSAAAFTSMRWMAKPQSPLIAVNYFTACCTITTFAWLLISQLTGVTVFHAPETLTELTLLVFSGASGFIMQILITLALQRSDSSSATNVVYTQIFFALVVDYFIFGAALSFLSLCGTVLILGCVVYQLFV